MNQTTLEQLEKTGELLFGPRKPDWFKGDCSIPKFLGKLLRPLKAKECCTIHDWCYLLIPILYEPDSPAWQLALHKADAELRWNLVKLSSRPWLGRLWGWTYYVGVRMPFFGGRNAVEDFPGLHPRRPHTDEQLSDTIDCARRFNDGQLTNRAKQQFAILAYPLVKDIRKELNQ